MGFLDNLLNTDKKILKEIEKIALPVLDYEKEMASLSDEELKVNKFDEKEKPKGKKFNESDFKKQMNSFNVWGQKRREKIQRLKYEQDQSRYRRYTRYVHRNGSEGH